ncbi:DUF4983 domain-containing protein [Chryseobacterium indologenes]|uniref:DUF4983 domain-containing protein n=1 Tax=Chryseobacterium indologenes TaxID=253 RepID=UPI002D7F834B|nr:DUF4983 domain-containing protein [Chryseobacterium indologenes]
MWKTALPNDIIVNWAHQDITSSHPYYSQLLGNWKCDETSGNTLADSSPNANNMTVTGSPTYSANTVTTFKIFDYSATTRETDHLPTVLNWLCIPVQSAWGIDGINRIPVCSNESLATKDIKKSTDSFTLYPNPASTDINFRYQSEEKEVMIKITDTKGSVISTKVLKSSGGFYDENIHIEHLPAGIYFLTIIGNRMSATKTFIKK